MTRRRMVLLALLCALAGPLPTHAALAGCVSTIEEKTTPDPHGTRRWRPTDGVAIVCNDGSWERYQRPGKNRSLPSRTFDPVDAMDHTTKDDE